jgi:hypothetical protein
MYVMFTTDQRHLLFVSFYRLLDDDDDNNNNVILDDQAEGSSPESPEGSDNKKPAGRLHPTKQPPVEPKVMFARTAPNNNSTTKMESTPAFAANDAATLSSGAAAPAVGWGAGGVSGWASTGKTTFASGTITVPPGTFAAASPSATTAAAVAPGTFANIGASNTAAPIGTARNVFTSTAAAAVAPGTFAYTPRNVFTLSTGKKINFGASMSATAGGSDAPSANSLTSVSRKRRASDEETAQQEKRSRSN